VGRALARVALAGNPSDGFGGAVLAAVVPGLEAVVVAEDPDPAVVGYEAVATGPAAELLAAAAGRLRSWCEENGVGRPDRVALSASTTIPVSVGLAGSSALVIAAVRALSVRWEVAPAPLEVARLALDAETMLLGIAAGPQDRVVQAAGRTVQMEFGDSWSAEPVDPPEPVELLVVWSAVASEPSTAVHRPLQARRGEPAVVRAMARLADLARHGAAALAAGDRAALGAAMDGSYEVRASIMELDPAHVALVDGARAAGASVNYAGSGGAVVALPGDAGPDGLAALQRWAHAGGHGSVPLTVPAAASSG
jgi:glucuronokinase